MQQDIRKDLRLRHARRCFVTVEIGQSRIIILLDNRNQPIIFGYTRPGKFGAVIIQNCIKLVWVITFAR
jgi:hypothetical protein